MPTLQQQRCGPEKYVLACQRWRCFAYLHTLSSWIWNPGRKLVAEKLMQRVINMEKRQLANISTTREGTGERERTDGNDCDVQAALFLLSVSFFCILSFSLGLPAQQEHLWRAGPFIESHVMSSPFRFCSPRTCWACRGALIRFYCGFTGAEVFPLAALSEISPLCTAASLQSFLPFHFESIFFFHVRFSDSLAVPSRSSEERRFRFTFLLLHQAFSSHVEDAGLKCKFPSALPRETSGSTTTSAYKKSACGTLVARERNRSDRKVWKEKGIRTSRWVCVVGKLLPQRNTDCERVKNESLQVTILLWLEFASFLWRRSFAETSSLFDLVLFSRRCRRAWSLCGFPFMHQYSRIFVKC